MKKIEDIDNNFILTDSLSRTDVAVYDSAEPPFMTYGLILPKDSDDECYRRLPAKLAEYIGKTNAGIIDLSKQTAGGRIRFKTDSDYIAVHAELNTVFKLPHMPLTGSAGFDLYRKDGNRYTHLKTFVPSLDVKDSFESEFNVPEHSLTEYIINFPLYCGVTKLYIILDKNAVVTPGTAYKHSLPVIYYGSSITQGGCASRPGTSYQSIISRHLDCDFVNLGFSGSAKAEPEFAKYISQQKMSVFVYDYDHNAPTPEYLGKTHERMFKIIREAQPDLPIVCVSRPTPLSTKAVRADADRRCQIIENTVNNAIKNGDKNVYYICGKDFCDVLGESSDMFVDANHPTDYGFRLMANKIEGILKQIFAD